MIKNLPKNKIKAGFTLVELLVVVAIIGVLTTLVLANFNAARDRARDVERKSDLDQIKKALRMYYNDNTSYPAAGALTWGSEFSSGSMVYMKALPEDPDSAKTYVYTLDVSGHDFCLVATLDNTADGDIAKSHTRCSSCTVTDSDYVVCAD